MYAQAAAGGAADIDRAVAAAREAFQSGPWPGWRRGPGEDPQQYRGRNRGTRRAIAAMETFDTGLPVTQAKGQAARAAENFRYFADVIVAQHEEAFSRRASSATCCAGPPGSPG